MSSFVQKVVRHIIKVYTSDRHDTDSENVICWFVFHCSVRPVFWAVHWWVYNTYRYSLFVYPNTYIYILHWRQCGIKTPSLVSYYNMLGSVKHVDEKSWDVYMQCSNTCKCIKWTSWEVYSMNNQPYTLINKWSYINCIRNLLYKR